jgi:hypothetical protein
MITTVELPDELITEAERVAAEKQTTLQALIESGLRRELSEPKEPSSPPEIDWDKITVPGGLAPGLDLSNRVSMWEWLLSHDDSNVNDRS